MDRGAFARKLSKTRVASSSAHIAGPRRPSVPGTDLPQCPCRSAPSGNRPGEGALGTNPRAHSRAEQTGLGRPKGHVSMATALPGPCSSPSGERPPFPDGQGAVRCGSRTPPLLAALSAPGTRLGPCGQDPGLGPEGCPPSVSDATSVQRARRLQGA